MSGAGPTPAPLRPSVFISYSSEDRTAARKLRDNLSAAGLEVWYDENELGGGDAWDQKIRRQIRDCDYFIPLISASTERRKEGYFRREWRLAAERTMDMADDVLFLVPIVIDETSEIGARVPDKFVTVQWLRAPGGETTPALETLTKRLLAGEHVRPTTTRPPLLARPSTGSAAPVSPPTAAPPPEGPPPMPPFPHHPPHSGHWPKYFAEVLWWFVTAVWTIFVRLPKFFRIILGVWLLITILGMCKSSTSTKPKPEPKPDAAAKSGTMPPEAAEALKALKETAEGMRAGKGGRRVDYGRIGQEIARQFGASAKTPLKGKALAIIPFDEDRKDRVAAQFTDTVFSESYGKLLIGRPGAAGISPTLPGDNNEAAFAEVGRELGVEFVLAGWQAKNAEGAAILEVRLVRVSDGTAAWSATYPIVAAEATAVAEKVASAVMAALPKKSPPPANAAPTPPPVPAPTPEK